MSDTANAPERIWTADTTGIFSVGFNVPSLYYKNEYVLAIHCDELVAAARAEGAREAQAKIARLTEALKDVTEAFGEFVDRGTQFAQPYEHPLSAYDRAREIIEEYANE